MTCTICQLEVKEGAAFLALPNAQGLLTKIAHLNCAAQDISHTFDGLPSYLMNPVRAAVLLAHELKANG